MVGYACLSTAFAIQQAKPRQVQFAVEKAEKAVANVGVVDRDDVVLLLACGGALLMLNTGYLFPLLNVAVLIENADYVGATVLLSDDVLRPVALSVLIPAVLTEAFLQRPDRDACIDGDRLDALLGEVRELTKDVNRAKGNSILAWEASVEPL